MKTNVQIDFNQIFKREHAKSIDGKTFVPKVIATNS